MLTRRDKAKFLGLAIIALVALAAIAGHEMRWW